ncbi:MAG: molybdopterin-binding protein [Proteocatella sp.]
MYKVRTQDSVGKILIHDVTKIVADGEILEKYPVFRKNHVIREEDIEVLLSIGKEYIYAGDIDPGMVHENDAALMMGKMCENDYLEHTGVSEGRVDIVAQKAGLLKINTDKLYEINSVENFIISTLRNNSTVVSGQKIAGMKIIPLMIEAEKVEYVKNIQRGAPLMTLKPYVKTKAGLVITGSEIYHGRRKDAFTPIIESKLEEFDADLIGTRIADDDEDMIAEYIELFLEEGAEIVFCTGGMSVDPDDKTPLAIRKVADAVVSQGAPVVPGAMWMLAYKGEIPIMGVPGGAIFSKRTTVDIILPRLMANDRVTRRDIVELSHGGYCLKCKVCHFPNCRFGN